MAIFDVLTVTPGRKKLSQSGWYSFNAVCCHHRGHNVDKRSRGGIRIDGNNWSMHCFNCGFKCGFTLGKSISKTTKQFLIWCGVDETQIQKWNLESLQQKDLLSYLDTIHKKIKVKFKDHALPDGDLLDPNNPSHAKYIEYLRRRAIDPAEYPLLVTPDMPGRMGNRVIIPYTHNNRIVGHTSRFLDNKIPKYINEQQPGYVFGIDMQKPEWQVCILVEGIFDALSISGCALTHNSISDEQAYLLSKLRRKIIFVPDRDKTGLSTIERALELGYSVSIPNWEPGIKDVNDAVVKYGKFTTLVSILQSATTSKVKLEMQRKKIERLNG